MLTVRSGPVVGLAGQVALLVALEAGVGLSAVGWLVGIVCGVIVNAAVALGLSRGTGATVGPADLVTLTRVNLACSVAALTADSFVREPAVTALVALAAVALLLDAVDGWLARRTRTASRFGARFDGEADAFLILVLSVYVSQSLGGWVLAIGAARYAFAGAGWALPWMRRELPFRHWRKVVAAVQGVVLTVAAADLLPLGLTYAAVVVALALLAESFGRDVWWLWRHRRATVLEPDAVAGSDAVDEPALQPEADAEPAGQVGRSRRRPLVSPLLDLVAVLLVWMALALPNQTFLVVPGALLSIPIEGIVVAGLALVLPSRARRPVAAAAGLLLGVLVLVKVLDMGFFVAFDRPFDAVSDPGYLLPAVDLVRDSVGTLGAVVAVVLAVALLLLLLVGLPLAVGRLAGIVVRHRRRSTGALAGLLAVWLVFALSGVQNGVGGPVASAGTGRLAVGQVRAINAELDSAREFEAAAALDRFRPRRLDLLGGLRGKDVVVAFVESYGRTAVEGLPASSEVRAVLDDGTARLRAGGYSTRSAYLDSPTFGGLSWLAHSTLQSGLWVDTQQRYERLLSSNRMTLSKAFRRAGWRTVAVMPSYEGGWKEGRSFYRFRRIYGRWDLGYDGPSFGWSRVPDQFVLGGFQRLELERDRRKPLMAKIDLTSSHSPWAPLPRLVDWDDLGDGSVFDPIKREGESADEVWQDNERVKSAYAESIAYTLSSLISFVETYDDDDLVLIVVGDHQPATLVTGRGASHEVPISLVARDPVVTDAITGWGWREGLRPGSRGPVWPMDAFRDRFLTAYSPWVQAPARPAPSPPP